MASSSKKLGLGGIFELLGAALGVVALILMIVCNSYGDSYAFSYATLLNLGTIVGVVLAVVAAFSSRFSFDKKGYLGLIAVEVCVFLYGYVAVQAVNERILVISTSTVNALSGTTATVVNLSIAAAICLAVGAIFVIVGAFMAKSGETEDSSEAEAATA